MNIDIIQEKIKPESDSPAPFQEFAVMIALFESENGLHVVFEVRSENLNSQPGEICLPGGRLESDETPENTALRETCEELGICPDKINILGRLTPQYTPFRYALYPFVGVLDPFLFPDDICRNPDEVSSVFTVPLEWFLANEPLEYTVRTQFDFPEDFPYHLIQNGRSYAWKSTQYPILFYLYENYVIWGMTARIIRDFCLRITSKT